MVVTIDADYREALDKGHVAGIVSETPFDPLPLRTVTDIIGHIEAYQPGQFYRRELQCVDAVMKQLDGGQIEMILVDGYADFGTERAALGSYVYDKYHLPVIGIAKNPFRGCVLKDTEVFRGDSRRPLFVTCRGIAPEDAKEIVRKMAGRYRIPDLVKLADKAARNGNL